MTKRTFSAFFALAVAAGLSSLASAAGIEFTGNYGYLTGTGNGNVFGVLSLQGSGNEDFEWGNSGWDGSAETWSTSESQKATNTSNSGYYARSVQSLLDAGITASNLALVFQVNMAGNKPTDALLVERFSVDFINSNGTLAFSLVYTPTGNTLPSGTDYENFTGNNTDSGVLPGVGQGSSGWLYTIDDAQLAAFFGNGANRIGMTVLGANSTKQPNVVGNGDIIDVDDGADNFFFTRRDEPPVVPLPAAAWTGLSALAGLGLVGKIRRRMARD